MPVSEEHLLKVLNEMEQQRKSINVYGQQVDLSTASPEAKQFIAGLVQQHLNGIETGWEAANDDLSEESRQRIGQEVRTAVQYISKSLRSGQTFDIAASLEIATARERQRLGQPVVQTQEEPAPQQATEAPQSNLTRSHEKAYRKLTETQPTEVYNPELSKMVSAEQDENLDAYIAERKERQREAAQTVQTAVGPGGEPIFRRGEGEFQQASSKPQPSPNPVGSTVGELRKVGE